MEVELIKEIVGAKFTDRTWDISVSDSEKVIRNEYPRHVDNIYKCIRELKAKKIKNFNNFKFCEIVQKYGVNHQTIKTIASEKRIPSKSDGLL